MGHWVIRHGNVVWNENDVDTSAYAETGATQWWSSWAPSMCGLFNVELPVYQRVSWTKTELAATVRKIQREIAAYDDRWEIKSKTLGNDGMSTCRASVGSGAKHQSLRTYDIVVNKSNPLGYTLRGFSQEQAFDVAVAHEQTHALCDLSYTANNKHSRLATWNDDDGEFREGSEAAGAQLARLESLWNTADADRHLSSEMKDVIRNRLSYGMNLIDIDTVVNELCLVLHVVDVSPFSTTIRALIDFAELNLGFRAIGRGMQERVPKLRAL